MQFKQMRFWHCSRKIFIAVIINSSFLAAASDANEEFVPQWAKRVVWYQIFPERFNNGDPANDPTLEDIRGAWPHDYTSPWQIHPWTSDWYELQDYEQAGGKDIWHNIQRRRYGGDLKGIKDKLDYLQKLGVTAIYLNPIFEAPSSHKYDSATYHHVDPMFGPDPAGDRLLIEKEDPADPTTWVWTSADKLALDLIRDVHSRGMKIIFDGVFNHMGLNSWAFRDVVAKQQRSKYSDWFSIKSWDDSQSGTKFDYEGWFGVRELPEFRENADGIVEGPKQYIFAATQRWIDPNGDGNPEDGIDGWRLDVAFNVAHPFWKDWRRHVKAINPQAYLTAEVIDPIEALKPYLEGDEFDAVMNYNFAFTCAEYFIAEKGRISTTKFDELLRELREAFPPGVAYVQQNLFDSHDTNRIASHIVNRDLGRYRNWGDYFGKSKADNPEYDTRKPNAHEIGIQKLFVIFQMTYVGAPMIYYGTEAGMWGANDPCCRKPMVWEGVEYDPERYLPRGKLRRKADPVAFDRDLFEQYRKLVGIRNTYPALQLGDFQTVAIDDVKQLYLFSRNHESEKIIVIINNSDEPQTAPVKLAAGEVFVDVLNEEEAFTGEGHEIDLRLKEKWGRILVRKQSDSARHN